MAFKPSQKQLDRVLDDEKQMNQRAFWHVYYRLNGHMMVQAGFDRSQRQCELAVKTVVTKMHPTLPFEHVLSFAPNPDTPVK